jgi:peroxiredoxin
LRRSTPSFERRSLKPARPASRLPEHRRALGYLLALTLLGLATQVPVRAQKLPKMEPVRGTRVGNLAYDLSLKDLAGRPHSLRDLRGKQVVHVVFWATWCFPCIQEVPTLRATYTKYHDRGLEILAVAPNMDQTQEAVLALAKELKVNYPVLWDGDGAAIRTYRVYSIPQNFLIGKDGIIRYEGNGLPSDYDRLIESLLQEGGAEATSAR